MVKFIISIIPFYHNKYKCELSHSDHFPIPQVPPACVVRGYRHSPWRWSGGGFLHHGPSDDGLVPQVRGILPRHRRSPGEYFSTGIPDYDIPTCTSKNILYLHFIPAKVVLFQKRSSI